MDYDAAWRLTWNRFNFLLGNVKRYIYEYELPVRYKADPKTTVLKYLNGDPTRRARARGKEAQVTASAKHSNKEFAQTKVARQQMDRAAFEADRAARRAAMPQTNRADADTGNAIRKFQAFLGGKKKA